MLVDELNWITEPTENGWWWKVDIEKTTHPILVEVRMTTLIQWQSAPYVWSSEPDKISLWAGPVNLHKNTEPSLPPMFRDAFINLAGKHGLTAKEAIAAILSRPQR